MNILGTTRRDILDDGEGQITADTFSGGSGNDEIHSRAGNDTIFGGSGDDVINVYSYNGQRRTVEINGGSGIDTLVMNADFSLNRNGQPLRLGSVVGVEKIILNASAGVSTEFINSFDNIIFGSSSAGIGLVNEGTATLHITGPQSDWTPNERFFIGASNLGNKIDASTSTFKLSIYSGTGDDTLIGGRADDYLYSEGESSDRLYGGAGNDVLEGMNHYYSTDDIYYNGGSGNDTILAGWGDDSLVGGTGNDRLYGYNGNDRMDGGSGNDRMSAGNGHDSLTGDIGNDTLLAGAGNDKVWGEQGADFLQGGSGADQFIFVSAADSTVSATGRDTILDFQRSQGDVINLRAIDASSTLTGDQAFTFIGNKGFSGHAGELSAKVVSGDAFISGDINGDGRADFQIMLDGAVSLTANCFIL